MRGSEIAERAMLGAIMLDPARLADVQQWLEPGDFYAYRHGLVYTEMLALRDAKQTPTARAVLGRIIPSAEARRQVDGPYLHTLMEACPHPSRAGIYGRMVLEASIHRRTITRAEHLGYIAQSSAPADVVIDQIFRDIADWTTELQDTEYRWARTGSGPSPVSEGTIGAAGPPSRIADQDAEIATVASLLADPRQVDRICSWLAPTDFTHPDVLAIYTAINQVARAGQAVDSVTIMWELIRDPESTHKLDHGAVGRLTATGVPGYAGASARSVLQASLRRRTEDESRRLAAAAHCAANRPSHLTSTTHASLSRMSRDIARYHAVGQ